MSIRSKSIGTNRRTFAAFARYGRIPSQRFVAHLSLLLLAAACGGTGADKHESGIGEAVQAITTAETAIEDKVRKVGGVGAVGDPTSGVLPVPGMPDAQFRAFVRAVIVYSNDYGAVLLTPGIFNKWTSLASATTGSGENLQTYLGFPIRDFVGTAASNEVRFERGIVLTTSSGASTVYGQLYERYALLASRLGLPTAEEQNAPGGGRFQTFANGDIYWKADTGAFAVLGAVRDRWTLLGGAAGTLGYPTSDVDSVVDANRNPIGTVGRFEKGAIYQSAGSGAWELRGELLKQYEKGFGGPAGWLGFPKSGDAVAGSGDHFNDFEGGVLVHHLAADLYNGVNAFQSLAFRLNRISSSSTEGACGTVDLYCYTHIEMNGVSIPTPSIRWPESGDTGTGGDPNVVIPVTPIANSSLVFKGVIETKDSDGGSCGADDNMGFTGQTYDINNLWGLLASHEQTACADGGCATTNFSVDHPLPHDGRDFRGQHFWSFHNFDTESLSYDQYAATFEDVDPDESASLNPFNNIFFKAAYEGIASGGNCFGMSLESIYAEQGRSPWSEPIHQYFPATQGGARLTDLPSSQPRNALINDLNIKQGYQLGLDNVVWFLGLWAGGLTRDPNFNWTFLTTVAGDNPLISMTDDYLFGGAHTVRPYRWEHNSDSDCHINPGIFGCDTIHIADPNKPTGITTADTAIEIDKTGDTYKYDDQYSGSAFEGGRMFVMPYRNFNHTQITPFSDIFSLIEHGIIILTGSTGQVNQITDDAGRTFFEPGIAGPPTRWNQIRRDDTARVPNFAPLVIDNGGTSLPLQMYAGRGSVATHTYEVVPKPGLPDGTLYEMAFQSDRIAGYFKIPGIAGKPDKIVARNIGLATRTISAEIPAGSVAKQITFTVAGTEKQRWAELSALAMTPTQEIKVGLDNAGYDLVIDNSGPATTANLRVKSGPRATVVDVGTITIPPGRTGVTYEKPVTTLTTSGEVPGQNGWLIAPVTITLTAKDFSSKGIAAIETSHDSTSWLTYSAPFSYADQGSTLLYYRARDGALNQEAAKSKDFKIDTRVPVVTVSVDQATTTRLQPFVVHFGATDPVPGSGLASSAGTLDGAAVSNGQTIDLLWYSLGTHTVAASAQDVAGLNASGSAQFAIIATKDGLIALIQELRRRGEIDSDGIANALIVKVQNNALSDLLAQLSAQSGQHITVAAANLLTAETNYVILHP